MKLNNPSIAVTLAFTILLSPTVKTFAGPQPPLLGPELEKALLAEDWKAVAEICDADGSLTNSPVLRAIKGHACLALNRNNESLCLFLSITQDSDLASWDEWTKIFLTRHTDCIAALYFRGDSRARLRDWEEAVRYYTAVLKLRAKLQLTVALVRNALGVAYGTRGAIEDARTNLEQACALAPSFLDARASLGTLKITQRAPEGALTEFDEVLYVSPDFALALIGRGCALFRMGEWDEAEKSFTNCMQVACAQGPASVNLSILMEARMQQVSNQLAAATGGLVPGTTLQTEVQQLANRLATDLPSLRSPDQVQHYYEGLHQHYDLPTVALASDYVMKGLATHMLSLCQQANSYNQQYLETAQGAACKMGWGRTLADLGNAIDLVSKGAAVTKRVDVAFLTGAGSVLLKQGGQDLKDLSSSSLATANQAFRLASDSLQQAAQLNNIRVAVNQVFADPGGWKRTYSMDLSGNLGQDFTVARTMAGNVRAGADVLIVCNKPDVADVLRNEALNRGVAPAQIRIVPEFSQTLAGQFGSPSSVILNVRGGLNIGSIPTPGGVRAAVKKPFVDKGWNLVMPYGLLYEIKPSTATAVGADWRQ